MILVVIVIIDCNTKMFSKMIEGNAHIKGIATVNGTAALHLALQCANINSNHSVLVQSLTYIASFQSITAAGARSNLGLVIVAFDSQYS